MEEYKIIRSGRSLLPFINIPPEFKDINLEITIKPAVSMNNREKIEIILNRFKDVKPFDSVKNPEEWQKSIRDEW